MPRLNQIIIVIVGFVIVAMASPIALDYLATINSTFNAVSGGASVGSATTLAPVFTIFNVLLPVLYIIGVALYFVPHGGGGD